jgi:DUF1016 N-terminal domain
MNIMSESLKFNELVFAIQQTHETLSTQASKAVNLCLTIRNWLIGNYINEYELQGSDRAGYAESLFEKLAKQLIKTGLKRMDARELRRFHLFYITYPQIRESLSPILANLPLTEKFSLPKIWETVSPKLDTNNNGSLNGRLLLERLSFSHFSELLQIDLPLKRLFYEVDRTINR